ncbi:MAG TPA: glycosyltransferase [Acidimicrobiia bacterium]|nr:glycosyltransferase [Acidimicrobiia bacterium]
MGTAAHGGQARIGVLVVARNAASTLAPVLDRIPADFRPRIDRVLVGDDASQDSTYLVGLGYQEVTPDLRIEIVRHPRDLGYGGNQKWGYRYALEHGWDIVVLLHGDGQYAPELLPEMVAPLEHDQADAVVGSRMIVPGEARKGGMPLYKYLGNRVLTRVENQIAGLELSEWHSGYRAYSVAALQELPFEHNSDGFDFDTEVLVQLKEAGKRITEVAIPTYDGQEISRLRGLRYAKDVVVDVSRYRAHKMGFGTGELAFATTARGVVDDGALDDAHRRILRWLARRRPSRVLDLACGDGALSERLRMLGHDVTGVDAHKHDGVADRVDRFVEADLAGGIPSEVGDGYDIVIAPDVLERVREPDQLLEQCRDVLAPGGRVVVTVPNFGHWYPRLRVVGGFFDYDSRGILDAGHLRFFTRASFERLVRSSSLRVCRRDAVGTPRQVLRRGTGGPDANGTLARALTWLDDVLVAVRPTLFGYQFLYELERDPEFVL